MLILGMIGSIERLWSFRGNKINMKNPSRGYERQSRTLMPFRVEHPQDLSYNVGRFPEVVSKSLLGFPRLQSMNCVKSPTRGVFVGLTIRSELFAFWNDTLGP